MMIMIQYIEYFEDITETSFQKVRHKLTLGVRVYGHIYLQIMLNACTLTSD